MARSVAPRRLSTGRFEVALARPEDDAAVRALLARSVVEGTIRLTLEREPDARLAAAVEGGRHATVVARRPGEAGIVGMASRAVRPAWVNGKPELLGYLAQLRRAPGLAGGRRLLVEGFAACEATRRSDELPYDLTSIMADNRNARRLLERGLPGLPTYRRCRGFSTLTVTTGGRGAPVGRVVRGSAELLPEIAGCLERNLRRFQLAPRVTLGDLTSPERSRGLSPRDFFVTVDRGRVTGCLALWDQRSFKQVVVRGYGGVLGRLRPLVNAGLALLGRPRLPPPGRPLALAYLSHVAVDDDRPEVFAALVAAGRRDAAERGLHYLSLGFPHGHPLLPAARALKGRELSSVLYLVHRPEAADAALALDGRPFHVEVATL